MSEDPSVVAAMQYLRSGQAMQALSKSGKYSRLQSTLHQLGEELISASNLIIAQADPRGYAQTVARGELILDKTSLAIVQNKVAQYFGVPAQELAEGAVLAREVIFARHVAMYIYRTEYGLSFPAIAKYFNSARGDYPRTFNHTAVIHGVRRVSQMAEQDAAFALSLKQLVIEIWETNLA